MNSGYTATCGTCIAPAIIITPNASFQSSFQGIPQQVNQFPYQSIPNQYHQPYFQNFSQPNTCLTSCTTTCGPNLMQNYASSYPSVYQPQPQICLPQCPQPQFSQLPICPPSFQNCGPQSVIQNYPQCPPNVQCLTNYSSCSPNCLPSPAPLSTQSQERSKEIITIPYLPYSRQNSRGYPRWD